MTLTKTIIALFFLFATANIQAATRTATQSGAWSSTSTWGGSAVPTSADNAVIPNGFIVTLSSADGICKNLTVHYNTAGSITVNSTYTLTITDAIKSEDNSGTAQSPNADLIGGSGTIKFTGAGSTSLTPNQWGSNAIFTKVTFDPGAGVTLTLSQIIKCDGTITINSGTLSCSSAAELRSNTNGTGGETISITSGATLSTDAQIRQSSTATTYFQNVTINGTLSTTSYVNAKTLTIGASGIFKTSYVGTQGWWNTSSSPSTVSITSGGTIEFNGSGSQIIPASVTYKNLTLSGSGSYTTSASPLNISGNLSVSAGDHTLSTTNNISGSVNLTGGKLQGSSSTFNVGLNWSTNSNTIFQAGTSTVVANGAGSIGNTAVGSYEVFYNLTISGSYHSLVSDLQIGNALSVSGGELDNFSYVISAKSGTTPTCSFSSSIFETSNALGINGALTLATPTFSGSNSFVYDGTSQETGTFLPSSIDKLYTGDALTLSVPVTLNNLYLWGEFDLNGNKLTINNSSAAAIDVAGYIVSESTSSIVQWNMGTTTGAFVFPFGVSGTDIPFTFNKTSSGSANVSVLTRATGSANTPYASGVANMYTDNATTNYAAARVVDRWWEITKSAAVTADLTFSYLGSENTLTFGQTGTLYLQHWNGTSWDSPVGSGAGVTSGVGTVSATGVSNFSPYIISSQTVTLPVELLSFSGSCANNHIELNWSTASEINNDYFIIEKSVDGKNYKKIAQLNGAGNSNSKTFYSFTDEQSINNAYYKLSQTDFDGSTQFFPEIQTYSCTKNNFTMEAYSCKNGELNIQLNSSEPENAVLNIYNSAGQALISLPLTVNGNQTLNLPVEDNSNLFLIQITDSTGNSLHKKVVIVNPN